MAVQCLLGCKPKLKNTSNIIYRTFHIRWNGFTGTGFTIDHGSKQYLVTARHVVDGIESGKSIKIFHDNKWRDFVVNVVGIGKGDVDVAVLACSVRLSPSFPLIASSKDITTGHPVSFLGYPFGWDAGNEQINRGVPMPFVKAGIVSAMVFGDISWFFLDAHGNGSSGDTILNSGIPMRARADPWGMRDLLAGLRGRWAGR